MTFLYPEFIYYMLPPLILLFALLLTQKEKELSYFTTEVADKLRVSANTLTLKARNGIFFLMGVLLIFALANPVLEDGNVEVKAKSADVLLALDISDSMLATDIYPNRLEGAKLKALALIRELKNERVGIVAFAKNSYLVSPMSFDKASVAFLLQGLNTTFITEQGTDFLPLLEVVSRTQKDKKRKYLLLLSDGGDKSDFSEEIDFAKKNDITVFILAIATKKGAPIRRSDGSFIKENDEIVISKLNENIARLATETGGVYIEGTSASNDVKAMLKEIASLEDKAEIKSKEVKKYIPLFYYPLSLALLLLLLATSSLPKRERAKLLSFLALLFFLNMDVRAGVFDFVDLREAKEAYESQGYEKASQIYKEYAQKNSSPEAHYNAANSLYKQGKYEEAIQEYKKTEFKDTQKESFRRANLGNAYAKVENFEEAIKEYEESLRLKEDKDVRENLQEVKKRAKEKQNPQSQDSKKDKENKEDKNKDKQDEQKQKEQKEQKQESKKDKEQDTQKEPQKDQFISDAEEQKWLKELNKESKSHLYKLDSKVQKSDKSDKPW
ncbi:MAG: Ca-activated chloride channel [Campylobacterota bacterium]|nr:Ca-activated chloride channel [Campylobacterota bacterium]